VAIGCLMMSCRSIFRDFRKINEPVDLLRVACCVPVARNTQHVTRNTPQTATYFFQSPLCPHRRCCCERLAFLTAVLALLLDELGDQAGPARLMARAHAGPVVAVEVLVERHIVAPVRIVLEILLPAKHRPPAVVVAHEDADEAP